MNVPRISPPVVGVPRISPPVVNVPRIQPPVLKIGDVKNLVPGATRVIEQKIPVPKLVIKQNIQYDGFEVIDDALNLRPTIPNIRVQYKQSHVKPAGVPLVTVPDTEFTLKMTPEVVENIAQKLEGEVKQTQNVNPSLGVSSPILDVLREIDPNKLINTRVGSKKIGYDAETLQDFLNRLNLAKSGKPKRRMIDEILQIARNHDFQWNIE